MSAQLDATTCLDIPVPLSLRRLVSIPPVCHPSQGDIEAIDILRSFGKELHRPANEIAQACSLASGSSDIVIILERPRRIHKYDGSFTDFVRDCRTLQAVDELIQFAKKGSRGIHTSTIVDLFSFQPDEEDTSKDERCQSVLAQILQVKKPRVVLCCHRSGLYKIEALKCLEFDQRDHGPYRKKAVFADGHETDVLKSFHPSRAINHKYRQPEFRALLMHEFVAAFALLNKKFEFPDSDEEIRKLCVRKVELEDIPGSKSWIAARFISKALKEKYEQYQVRHADVSLVDDPERESQILEMESFDDMYAWLGRLFGRKNTFGTLGIASIITFLLEKHFKDDPIRPQMRQWLLIRGNEQEDWFPSPGHDSNNTLGSKEPTSLEHSFARMNTAHSSDHVLDMIISVNDEAVQLTSSFLGLSRSGVALDPFPKSGFRELMNRHMSFIYSFLRTSSSSNIGTTLRIRALMKHCHFVTTMIANSLADSKDEYERDLEDLLGCVKQLRLIFEFLSTC